MRKVPVRWEVLSHLGEEMSLWPNPCYAQLGPHRHLHRPVFKLTKVALAVAEDILHEL